MKNQSPVLKLTLYALAAVDVILLLLGIMHGRDIYDWLVLDALLFIPIGTAINEAHDS